MTTHGGAETRQARKMLGSARRIAVLTGAGISAESGVPTFRGAEGLWKGRPAADLATPEAFNRDPEGVWEFYRWRIRGLSEVVPNAGHQALVTLERSAERFWLVTQNVDGLHRAAGSSKVIELHGTLAEVLCRRCGRVSPSRGLPEQGIPSCGVCAGPLRPNVVWFGETLPADALAAANEAIRDCEVMLVVGTSGVVEPAASFARWAAQAGASVIEVNLEPTPITRVAHVSLFGRAGLILPRLVG